MVITFAVEGVVSSSFGCSTRTRVNNDFPALANGAILEMPLSESLAAWNSATSVAGWTCLGCRHGVVSWVGVGRQCRLSNLSGEECYVKDYSKRSSVTRTSQALRRWVSVISPHLLRLLARIASFLRSRFCDKLGSLGFGAGVAGSGDSPQTL